MEQAICKYNIPFKRTALLYLATKHPRLRSQFIYYLENGISDQEYYKFKERAEQEQRSEQRREKYYRIGSSTSFALLKDKSQIIIQPSTLIDFSSDDIKVYNIHHEYNYDHTVKIGRYIATRRGNFVLKEITIQELITNKQTASNLIDFIDRKMKKVHGSQLARLMKLKNKLLCALVKA